VIIALGGYVALGPPSGAATPERRDEPAATAPANPAVPAPAAATTPAPPAGAAKAPAPATPPAAAPAAAPESAPRAGAIDVVSAISLNLSEGGRALGTSGTPIALPPGRHSIELVREDLGYRAVEVVDVRPGQTTKIQPALPTGAANLNAIPWAEVWIDGQKVGETPLGQVPLTIGSHEVQFRHPDFETQTRTVVVAVGAAARVSVEFKK
jgi:pyruvate/2-oxoglutarate dehydrogenase complex dihydrolipoamide acyltransferase (E2) component